jgi:hypothetical protein
MHYMIKPSLCLGSTLLRHMEGIIARLPITYNSVSSNYRLLPVTANYSLGLYLSCRMLYLTPKV